MKLEKSSNKIIINRVGPTLGCDPELFLKKEGRIIGSEKVIPPKLPTEEMLIERFTAQYESIYSPINYPGHTKETRETMVRNAVQAAMKCPGMHGVAPVVRDGVQVEIHPSPGTCRQGVANNIGKGIKLLQEHLDKKFKGEVEICLDPVVELDDEEFQSLSDESKTLGCQPSLNIYEPEARFQVPPDYRTRSAGGHIHLGINKKITPEEDIVRVMDYLVGNTCVLIDKSNQKERRKVYGRAGEYRKPAYGVEYRTLSNFWLRDYRIMGLVFGLARLAYGVVYTTNYSKIGVYASHPYTDCWDAQGELLSLVNPEAIRTAINENDFDLALSNYRVIREWIKERVSHQTTGDHGYSLGPNFLNGFDHFIASLPKWVLNSEKVAVKQWIRTASSCPNGWEHYIGGSSSE